MTARKPWFFQRSDHDLILSLSFCKRLLRDQQHIRQREYSSLIKRTQLNPGIPLFLDRENEIRNYFRIPRRRLWDCYLRNGFPNTSRFKKHLQNFFHEQTSSSLLMQAYQDASFNYALRLMMAFERYSMVLAYLNAFYELGSGDGKSLEGWTILDFGCGVSDIGLILALLGARLEICDLRDQKFLFAAWRYQVRKLPVLMIPQESVDQPPLLESGKYDLIIATEVFEHLLNPLQNLRVLTRSLKPGGLLFNSLGENGQRELGGDHLEGAQQILQSPEYRSFYRRNYQPVSLSPHPGFLFRLGDPCRP